MTVPNQGCLGCRFAVWEQTKNGRLHPNGRGTCSWKPTRLCVPFYVRVENATG